MENTKLKRIVKGLRRISLRRVVVRVQSLLALTSFVFSILTTGLMITPQTVNAQEPIYPIGLTGGGQTGNPALSLDNYDAAGMGGFFQDVANQANDVDSWISLVVDGLGMQRAAWESSADLQIQNYVDNLNVSDSYNGIANYRDALLKELESQKEAALEVWEQTANTDIVLQLNSYLANLTKGIYTDSEQNTETDQSNADALLQNGRLTPEQVQQQYNESRERWESEFQTSADNGVKQYNNSLTTINDDYTRFLDQLDSADANFQQNLQALNDYKMNVVSGIDLTVKGLSDFLHNEANHDLFYTGDGTATPTTAGRDLTALIADFRTKIDEMNAGQKDFSLILTQLGTRMRDYLGTQAGYATITQAEHAAKVDIKYVNADEIGNADMYSRVGLQDQTFRDNNGNMTPAFGHIWTYMHNQPNSLSQFVKDTFNKADPRYQVSILDTNMFAYSDPYRGDAVTSKFYTTWGTEKNFKTDKDSFHYYEVTKNFCFNCSSDHVTQEHFTYKISYSVHDTKEAEDSVTWQSFANQLNTQFNTWSNTILPAIGNWEAQAANYKDFYAQWKSNADTMRVNAKTEYEASVAKVESDKSKWFISMENQKRDADANWDKLEEVAYAKSDDMTGSDLSALLNDASSVNGVSLIQSQTAGNFSNALAGIENTRFTFNKTDYNAQVRDIISPRTEIAKKGGELDFGQISKMVSSNIVMETVKSGLTDPFGTQNSYSVFNPDIKAPDLSVTGIDLDKAFSKTFNGVQNFAYVNGTTALADKYQQEYYDSIVNQYKYTFKEDVMYDLKMKAAIKEWNADPKNAGNQIALADHYDIKEARKKEEELFKKTGIKPPAGHEFSNEQLIAWEEKHKAEGDIAVLSPQEKEAYEKGGCYADVVNNCGKFMEVNKDLKSVKVENGQIVIVREISDGTIHKGSEMVKEGDPDYNLVGGYSSGRQLDVIRVSLSKMGSVIQNPKDLFTEWSNEDYNAIASNLYSKVNKLYASAANDSKLITNGVQDSVARGDRYMKLAMGAAQNAVAQDQMVQSIAQAYLTGGMAGIQSMIKDKIRDAFIDKVAEATGINPDLVRFATGRFEQAKVTSKMNSSMGGVGKAMGSMMGSGLGAGLGIVMGPVGFIAGAALGATAGGKLGKGMLTGGGMGAMLNNPVFQAGATVVGTAIAGPAGGMAMNKALKENSLVKQNNQLNALKQQENALIQDVAGRAVANAIGRPDAAGNFSQILGGLKKRQVAKRQNAHLDTVVSSGVASGMKMVSGVVNGIVKNAVVAFGGSGENYDRLTASPFTPTATWTGAAKVDMSKEGWKNRLEEKAMTDFLVANGMDESMASTVASTTNGKIKAKKAKKEERINAIESTAVTAIAVAAMAVTAGAATPLLTAMGTTAQAASTAINVASIGLSTAIGSRTGGTQGAAAGFMNGVLNAAMPLNNPKPTVAFNISYDKKNGWGGGIGIGGNKGNLSINASQRGGAQISLGTKYGSVNYNTANGTYGANVNVDSFLGGTKETIANGMLASLGANVGWNSASGASAGISYSLNKTNSIGLNFDRQGANITGEVDNTNLFTSSSDGSFQVNTNFANERLTNLGVNQAQEGFDREMEAREIEAGDALIRQAKPPFNNDPSTMSADAREAALKRIGHEMAANGNNKAAGTSNRNPILGEIGDGFRNIGQAFGVGNRVSGESGFVDADGKFHPRTCFTKGTLVTKLKARYYEEARNGGLTPDARYEEKVAIETIKAGDFVLSFDENTKVKSYKKVTDRFVRTTEFIYTVSFVNGEKLETTWNHPFWVLKKSVVRESGQVELGASLVAAITSPNLSDIDSSSISSPLRSGKGTGDYASRLDGEWISAKDLKAGDVSLTAGGKRLLIASITPSSKSETVYNFAVADNHTYFVGVDGVLVHNQDSSYAQALAQSFRASCEGKGAKCIEEQHANFIEKTIMGLVAAGAIAGCTVGGCEAALAAAQPYLLAAGIDAGAIAVYVSRNQTRIQQAFQYAFRNRTTQTVSEVWSRNPFLRGRILEQQSGMNLPANFPVIDRWANGVATSIKSMNLNSNTYENASQMRSRLLTYVNDLSAFNGRTWAGANVQGNQIRERVLELIVPHNGTATQQQVMSEIVIYAERLGIKVDIVVK